MNITFGFPELLLVGGVVLMSTSPGALAISIVAGSVIGAVMRAALDTNFRNAEKDRLDKQLELQCRAEERVDEVMGQLVSQQKFDQAAKYIMINDRGIDGSDDGNNNGGSFH